MNEQEWNKWLDRLLDGDPEAFELIYGMTKKKVYGTVVMLGSNMSERNERLHEEISPVMPDDLLVKNESQEEMLQLILRLPFKMRSVVLYRYYYDYTYEEIAELRGIPVGTVKSRNHKAVEQMRQRFGSHLEREVYSPNV